MNIQTINEGLKLMDAVLYVNREANEATVYCHGVQVTMVLDFPQKEIETALFFLNLNMPNWLNLIKEALEDEKEKKD